MAVPVREGLFGKPHVSADSVVGAGHVLLGYMRYLARGLAGA